MPGRRHYRGPRRPGQPAGDATAGGLEPQARTAPMAGDYAEGSGPVAAGEGTARRRRRRGGRGPRPEGDGPSEAAASVVGANPHPNPLPEGEGTEGPKRRRRRRSGRNRTGQVGGGGTLAPEEEELEDGAPPSDYIAFQVERGTPLVYHGERALVPVQDEEDEPEPERRPAKSRRINSGKLFWYIRSKSYIPIPELRRRFEVSSEEMSTIQDDGKKIFVGLPQDLADVVATLRRQNKIGLEVAPEFSAPVVVGIYPLFH